MNRISVTVAIACFNHGHFLAEAIQSVLNQTRPANEIIVVDDGSTDNTRAMAGTFDGVRYQWKSNGGLSSARNTALGLAQSSYILFLDADDLLLPSALEEGLNVLAAYPDAALAYGGYDEVSVSGDRKSTEAEGHDNPFNALLRWNFIGMHGTVIYKTSVLQELGGFDTNLRVCEDWDVYLRLARYHDIRPYPCIAAEYRRVEGSLSKGNPLRMLDTAHAVLQRQEGLTEEQRGAVAEGLKGTTRVYSLIAAWSFMSFLRDRQYRDALSLARSATSRDRFFPARVAKVGFEIFGSLIAR